MADRRIFRFVALNCRYTHSCLALFYVRHALETHLSGVEIDLLPLTINDPYYQALQRILEGDPGVLLFSAYIWNASFLHRLVVDIAHIRPGWPIIIGGPQAGFLGDLPNECTLVHGEIEGVDPSFYRDLGRGDLKPSYRAGEGADFPFPYRADDFSTHLHKRQILYESSRGCPFSCSYCLSAVGTSLVHKNISTVQAELEQILSTGPPLIKFVDRTFNDRPERALAIWKKLVEIGDHTRFHFEVAPDRFTKEQLDFLETVPIGLFQFEIGIQSTNTKTLAAVHRQMDVERALATIRRLRAMENIHLHVDLILGLPEDDWQSFGESFCRVFACLPHHIQMGLLKVLPATPLAGEADKYGIIHCVRPPYEVLTTATMDNRTLADLFLFGECVERFYNNRYFPSLWRYLEQIGENAFVFFESLLTVCRETGFFQRAATQELMVELLVSHVSERSDFGLLRELLIFDWLRCGHRFIPEIFQGESLAEQRTRLRKTMPLSYEPLYSERERNRFFKQGIFYPFSAKALRLAGLAPEGQSAVVCFQEKQDFCLLGLCRIALLPDIDREFT
ncbi:MAG TPA: DUF4080 domain-containing protein [Desulfobulbaceae bacterium]|nr:DUF4080 domain-containing protein [Desulfobulbaceae bacterium]